MVASRLDRFKPKGWGRNRSSVGTPTDRADDPPEAFQDAYESYMRRAQELEPNQCVGVKNYVEALISEKSTLDKRCSTLMANYEKLEANIRGVVETLPGNQVTNENARGDKKIEDLLEQIPGDFYHVVDQRDKLEKKFDQLSNQHAQLSYGMKCEVSNLKGEVSNLEGQFNDYKRTKEEEKEEMQQRHLKELQELKNDLELRFLNSADDFQPRPDKKFNSDITTLKLKITGIVKMLKVTKAELGTLFDQKSFVESVNTDREAKLVLEHVLWKILFERLFSTPFRVFGEHGDGLFKIWCQIFQNGEMSQPQSELNRRNTTVRASYEKNLDTTQKDMEAVIQRVSPDPTAHQNTLKEIVGLAAKLALACSVQHCRIQPSNLPVGFKANQKMKNEIRDRNTRNSAGTTNGIVRLFISPGLQRIGDGKGGSMDRPRSSSMQQTYS
ncbi:hypothetical protein GQ44DRAFT_818163 [Phaeosphaeriaceae sp. PMI808]|nr:hypothetical protein GQ44DRAFT_818163 [Phaeosphaeriaceae sp. PMI808]